MRGVLGMEKMNEIIKTLNFYVKADELKNKIIDEPNNYSVADHIFGSMILATAIDSEFKETSNVSKIYRMMLLGEFSNLYPNYNFEDLKLGKQYKEEILEAKDMNTENGKLVFKYKMLDFLLTKLIKEKENNIEASELIKEGSSIIASLCSKMPSECEEIFKFYHLNFRLKNKVRSGWDKKHWNIKSNRIERVSEHVIGTLSLAIALNSEFENNFDTDKEIVASSFIYHINEILPPDISVNNLRVVSSSFHAQKSAKARYYKYELINRRYKQAFDGDILRVKYELDVERMQTALNFLLGEHDFSSFKSSGTLNPSKVCILTKAEVEKQGDRIFIHFVGNRFLYNMVRTIVGTLLEIEGHKLPVEHMKEVLEAHDRRKAGQTVNPYGLTLMRVEYPAVNCES